MLHKCDQVRRIKLGNGEGLLLEGCLSAEKGLSSVVNLTRAATADHHEATLATTYPQADNPDNLFYHLFCCAFFAHDSLDFSRLMDESP